MKKVFCLILCLGFISIVSYGQSSASSLNIVGCWVNQWVTLNIRSDGSVKCGDNIGKWQLLDDRLILRWDDGKSDTHTIIKQTSNLMIIKYNGLQEVTYDRTECKLLEYKIGDRGPSGGWIFYDKGNSSDGWRYLEAASEDQADRVEWGCYEKSIPGAKGTAVGTGKSNTQAIIKSCGEAYIAARKCTAYRGGGKSDWFLPSKDELDLMYNNLYKKGVGGFAGYFYWSSSEGNADQAWLQLFSHGNQGFLNKNYDNRVRAVRAVRDFNN
jgi:hypothetical protein